MSNREETAYIEVRFTSRSTEPVREAQQEGSLCASGYVYLGSLKLICADMCCELPVQTGGWMNADSPFARAGLCPKSTAWGAYSPHLYPDTAFPVLPGDTILFTLRTGKRCGFRVPDPPDTGRTALMVHDSVRYGSEGCISTPSGPAWDAFCATLHDLHTRGVTSIPLRVIYDGPSPEPLRCPDDMLSASSATI